MLNGSQFPNEWVMSVAHYVIQWERELHNSLDGQDYLTNFIPNPAWWSSPSNAARAEHVVFQATAANVQDIVCKSQSRGSPMLYIHDQAGAIYTRLPSFFEAEVNAVAGCPDVSSLRCGSVVYDGCGNQCPGMGQACGNPLQRCDTCGFDYWVCMSGYC